MVKEQTLTVSLEEFGLSKYEARAYVTLITRGIISASELAYYAELPRTKVYSVLLKLQKKKLAMITKSKPIMCTATAPEDAFDDIIHEQIDKVNAMNSLVTNLKKISENSKKARGAEEKRYFNLAANNVLNQLRSMIKGTESSIQIMVDQYGLNLLSECSEQLLLVLRREIDVKVIIPPSQVGSEPFRKIPDGARVKMSDIVQNCFIFDNSELLVINNESGKGAIFSATEILGHSQKCFFENVWQNSLKTDSLADLTKNEAQEIYKTIDVINQKGLNYLLDLALISKTNEIDFLKLLEKNGINLKSKSLEEITEMLDSALQITCSGHVKYEPANNNITIESKLNSGNSLPWVVVLESYLKKHGYKTRKIFQNPLKGEKVHIKITSH